MELEQIQAWGEEKNVEKLLKVLTDDDEFCRKVAVRQFGDIRDKRTVEPVIRMLEDDDDEVRCESAEVLGNIGDLRAVGPLIKALSDKHEYVRSNAAIALGKLGDDRAVEPLIKALSDKEANVIWDVIPALGKLGDDRAVEPLIKMLRNKETVLQEKAAKALGDIGDVRAVKPLIKAINDNPFGAGVEAATALGKLGDKSVLDPLRKLRDRLKSISEKDYYVVEAALFKLGEKGIARKMEKDFCYCDNHKRCEGIVSAYKLMYEKEELAAKLIELLKYSFRGFHEIPATQGLRDLRHMGQEAIGWILKALDDIDLTDGIEPVQASFARWEVTYALLSLSRTWGYPADERYVELLMEAIGDRNEHLRKEAAEGLAKVIEEHPEMRGGIEAKTGNLDDYLK